MGVHDHAFTLPWTPAFLNKHGGLVLGIGQFNQWVGSQVMATGLVQIWPGTPVSKPLISGRRVEGLRLADQAIGATFFAVEAARSARLARRLTSSSACRKATRTASGLWA